MQLTRKHPLTKRLRALREQSSQRDSERCFVAEGFHLVHEALNCGARIEFAVIAPSFASHREGPELIKRLRENDTPIWETEGKVMDLLQDARSPQPVLAVIQRTDDEPLPANGASWSLASCGIQDPGNFGAILRSAAAFELAAVYCVGGVDPFHPRAVRASMGAIFHLPVYRAKDEEALCHRLRQDGWSGLALEGSAARSIRDFDRGEQKWALLLGSEAHGLSETMREFATEQVSIPISARVESLSAPVAAALACFQLNPR